MMNPFRYIARWFGAMSRVFANEWTLITHDVGALIFFVGLPLMYPIVYTLIYNPEVVRELPVVVVDHCRTARSRSLVRDMGASPTVEIYDYVPTLNDAKTLMAENKVVGILEIPADYGKKIGRMEQAHASFYCQMNLLLRYRGLGFAIAEVQLKDIAEITTERASMLGAASSELGTPINQQDHMLGDIQQGFASFVMPGIVVLILQQSMVLGICLMGGTSRERRRRNGGTDPLWVNDAPLTALVMGRALTYTVFYIAPTIFLLHYIPVWFDMPHWGSPVQWLLFAVPLVLASAFFGQTLNIFCREREDCFITMVWTSVFFLFLSGLTWPRYAMPDFWVIVGDFIPAVWGVEGFIRINSNGAGLAENATPFLWMWGLAAAYYILAVAMLRIITARSRRTALN